MNEELVVKFLDKVGVDNIIITQLKEPEDGLDIDALAKEFKASQREVYANNHDVIVELDKRAKGKERGSVERKIKKVVSISNDE